MTPFKPQRLSDLSGKRREAPDWLVAELLPRGILALLAAYPKVGKSTLAAQLTVAVAQGRDFLGRPCRQGGVLIVVAEEREDDVMRRLARFGAMEERDPIWLWSESVFDSYSEQSDMEKWLKTHEIALVVIDTLSSYLLLDDETDNSKATKRLKVYADMAHHSDTTIMFVHHERKSGDESGDSTKTIRGAGAILGIADLAFQLHRGNGNKRRLSTSGRYDEIPRLLLLALEDDVYVSLGTPEEAALDAQMEKVVAALTSEPPGVTVGQIVGATELKEKVVRKALASAVGRERVQQTGSGKRGDALRYYRILSADTTVVGQVLLSDLPAPSSIDRPRLSEPSSNPVEADDESDLFDREIDYEEVERILAANGIPGRPR